MWRYVDRYALPEWTVEALLGLDYQWLAAERARRAPPPGRAREAVH